MRRALAITLLFLSLAAEKASALSMNLESDAREGLVYVNLWGSVEAGDGDKFRQLITPYLRAGYLLYEVNIFSTGGLVVPAINIGEQIRQLGARTRGPFVLPQGRPECWFAEKTGGGVTHRQVSGYHWCTCASACAMIWMSGLTRDGNVVGIHRFSFANNSLAGLNPLEAQQVYNNSQEQALSYYRSIGLPASLSDRMLATKARDLYYLQDQDLELVRSAPFLEEYAVQLCGAYPSRPVDSGSRTLAVDGAENACFIQVLKTLMRRGVQAYLTNERKIPLR